MEECLDRYPGVAESAVAGVPDPEWGERVTAWVVLRPGFQLEVAGMKAFAAEHLSSYKAPKEFHIVELLPRNAMGKLDRRRLVSERIGAATQIRDDRWRSEKQ